MNEQVDITNGITGAVWNAMAVYAGCKDGNEWGATNRVAELMDVTQTTASNWHSRSETAYPVHRKSTLCKIAKVLGIHSQTPTMFTRTGNRKGYKLSAETRRKMSLGQQRRQVKLFNVEWLAENHTSEELEELQGIVGQSLRIKKSEEREENLLKLKEALDNLQNKYGMSREEIEKELIEPVCAANREKAKADAIKAIEEHSKAILKLTPIAETGIAPDED